MTGGRERGASIAEAMAALTLLALVVTTGISVLLDSSRLAAGHDAAAERLVVAERLMERTLAQRPEARGSHAVTPGAAELDGRPDRRATVTVRPVADGLQRIEVEVRDRRGRTRLMALSAPWEGGS